MSGGQSFLFVEFDTSSSVISNLPRFTSAVCFDSFLFPRYALSSQSVHSRRTRSEIFCKNVDYLHFKIFVMPRCIDLSLSGFARECCSFTLRKLKGWFREKFCIVKVMLLACIRSSILPVELYV